MGRTGGWSGGKRAWYVTPYLSYDQGESKTRAIKILEQKQTIYSTVLDKRRKHGHRHRGNHGLDRPLFPTARTYDGCSEWYGPYYDNMWIIVAIIVVALPYPSTMAAAVYWQQKGADCRRSASSVLLPNMQYPVT